MIVVLFPKLLNNEKAGRAMPDFSRFCGTIKGENMTEHTFRVVVCLLLWGGMICLTVYVLILVAFERKRYLRQKELYKELT